MHHLCKCPQFHSEAAQGCIHFSVVFVPDLVQGCGVEEAGVADQVIVAAGTEVAALLPETWAASVAVSSQDPSASELALSCSVEWAELGPSHWAVKHYS